MYRVLLSLFVLAALAPFSLADRGDPVAVIRLPGGGIAIETMWNLSVVIADSTDDLESKLQGVDLIRGNAVRSASLPGRFQVPATSELDHILDRPANKPEPSWQPWSDKLTTSPNAVRVRTIAEQILVEVDGVKIVYLTRAVLPRFDNETTLQMKNCNVLIIDTETQAAKTDLSRARRCHCRDELESKADVAGLCRQAS